MSIQPIKKIVILGGGSAGWLTAAALAKALTALDCEITLVESEDIGIIGVGEATIPPIVDFLKFLEIDEADFLKEVSGTYKLAIKFTDWSRLGEAYYHPFGTVGVSIEGQPFYSCWLKSLLSGNPSAYTDYSVATHLAQHNKFYNPNLAPKESFLSDASYAWHFDAQLVAKYMRKYASAKNVSRIEGRVVHVDLAEDGNILALNLANGTQVAGDFFIDCSGFESLLIGGSLQVPFIDWSHYLPCNRAVACPTENAGDLAPYTEARARESGWTWRIPLQTRTGNGYVFASDFCDESKAIETLKSAVKGKILVEPRLLKFTTGRRAKSWEKNCIALGLSAGFLEPLESTAIHLVMKGVRTFLELFPTHAQQESLSNEYNRIMNKLYEDIRDFIVLHYCTTQRDDSEFWRWCKQMPIPASLQNKMDLFKESGRLFHNPDDLFKAPSWYAVFHGMGVVPKAYDPLVDKIDFEEVLKILPQVKQLMGQLASGLPSHAEYLKRALKVEIK